MHFVNGMAALAVASTAVAANTPTRVEQRDSSSTNSGALPTITVSGNAFYVGNQRFYIRGVDYQPDPLKDPLSDTQGCLRDIPYFKQLGLNTIRVYTVDNSANHDVCMNALAEAGIYLVLDVNSPNYSLSRVNPAESYNAVYLQSVFATIDTFAAYTNTLGFFSGNEVINAPDTTNTAPFIKAVTRDMKQYIGERGYRAIPVGYSAADVAQNQYLMAQYMDCGEDQTRGDFYAINNYEWCDPSSFTTSGWDILVQQYANYSSPVFLSEYGCITNSRTFAETKALYQTDMTSSISGGLVYMYTQAANGYGLVSIQGNKVIPVGNQMQLLQQALSSTPNPSGNGGAHGPTKPQRCPHSSANWNIKPFHGHQLPALPSDALTLFQNGAGKPPGLQGGSQQAGTNNVATASAGAGRVTATFGSGPTHTVPVTGSSNTPGSGAASLSQTSFQPLLMCGLAVAISFLFGAAAL